MTAHPLRALIDAHANYNREALVAAVTEQRDKHPRPKEDDRGLVQSR